MDKRKKTIVAAVILSSIAATLLLAPLVYFRLPVQGQVSLVFTVSGDFAANSRTDATLSGIPAASSMFHLAVGDFSYSSLSESAWCDYVKTRVGSTFPFELISGNHDDGSDGHINNFRACLPDRLGAVGDYGYRYYFDYPSGTPILRAIGITPAIFEGYGAGSANYDWVASTIDDARARNIPWVSVFMHKNCISVGAKSCEIGTDILNLLVSKKVDLVFQGHDHNYQRTKQLAQGPGCSSVQTGTSNLSCVVDSDNDLSKGAGTVVVISGTGGNSLYGTSGSDSEAGYFKAWNSDTWGNTVVTLTESSATIRFARTTGGSFSDTFTIGATGAPTPPPTPPPTVPRKLTFVKDPTAPLLLGHTEPDVLRVGDVYYLYYRANGHIEVASSTDGLNFNTVGSDLTKSVSGWDSAEVITPSVLLDNGAYYLYYEADDASRLGNRAIGVATSASPTGPFTKHSGNPVLTPSQGWEGTIVGTPVISKLGANYYLFYHGYSGGSDRVGVAYGSSPLGPWTKEANNPILDVGPPNAWDDGKVAPSSVYFPASEVWLFYEGFDGTNGATQTSWRIGMANGTVDSDGRIKSLAKDPLPILDIGSQGSWDHNAVHLPSILFTGTEFWMYYSGHDGLAYRLGRAVAQVLPPPTTQEPCFLCGFLPTIFSSIGWLLLAGLVIGLAITLAIFKARSRTHRGNLGNRAMPSSPVSEPRHDSRLDEAFRQGKVSRGTYLRVRKRRRSTN